MAGHGERARLLCGDASGVGETGPPEGPDGLTALAVHPAGTGPAAVVYGRPGGDYGYLTEAGAPDRVLVRRPALVRLPRVPSATGGPARPGFVYTGFPPDARLEDPPVEGIRIAVHRTGEPFAHDRPVPLGDAPGALVTVEPTADPDAVLVKSTARGVTAHRLLRLTAGSGRPAVTELPAALSPRTRLVLGAHRWWRGEALGTPRAVLYALPPGETEPSAGQPVAFPDGTAPAWFWGTRQGWSSGPWWRAGRKPCTGSTATARNRGWSPEAGPGSRSRRSPPHPTPTAPCGCGSAAGSTAAPPATSNNSWTVRLPHASSASFPGPRPRPAPPGSARRATATGCRCRCPAPGTRAAA
ncbi:hypothetical protein ACFQ3Z_03790 [Streptomyces nogalater]